MTLTPAAQQTHAPSTPDEVLVTAAVAGDQGAFGLLTERYRRQLHAHCYRMLGSVDDADDVVQETFARAWQRRGSFEGRSQFRTWLYAIATNACLDALARRPRRVMPPDVGPPSTDLRADLVPAVELPWLQPYPDRLLEPIAPATDEPEAATLSRETMELAFLAAIQHLPARQRAVLVLRDVLRWRAQEVAELLQTTVASVNSALQRARSTMRSRLPERRTDWPRATSITDSEHELVRRYIEASEQADVTAFTALLRDDVRQTMPPLPVWWDGKESVGALNAYFLREGSIGELRGLPLAANCQPAVAFYLREPGDTEFRLIAIDVLRIVDGLIAEMDTFDPHRCPGFDLAETLP